MKKSKIIDNLKVSNAYIPGFSSRFYYRNLSKRAEKTKEIQSIDAIIDNDTVLQVGIASAKDRSKQYKELVQDLQIEEVNIAQIIEEIQME